MNSDLQQQLQEQVQAAGATGRAVEIRGAGSKRFHGREPRGDPLEVAGHTGILAYEPTELVITARAGTSLEELERVLAEQNQMLAFEPPRFGASATIGGTVACGLSGPRRPWAGAVRDHLLGTRIINGRGQILSFGGQVMKNVAGYDAFRLMCGALGTLGVLLEVSLKVLPRPAMESTLAFEMPESRALASVARWSGTALPVSAASFLAGVLRVRFSGSEPALAGLGKLGGERDDHRHWQSFKEQKLDFFSSDRPLWRLALPDATPPLKLDAAIAWEWGGQQRWLNSGAPDASIRETARQHGGHATLFRGGDRRGEVFQPLDPGLQGLHRNLKQAFDPDGLLNPGRLYPEL